MFWNAADPDFHPWWRGGSVHTLQSVTKPVAATVVGVAIERGDIAGDTEGGLYLEPRDLARIGQLYLDAAASASSCS